ncbi:LptF/LptG family permease [Sulfuriroseicoccus oceanibius]|uniref:LptF/LptG family permease n=1 Tax=Sulfuriroseicoccus oceanibius TaxID=2707525 RepID=A0A7T7EZ34_9BACT|nr:LptF/LptG family permease [Sulfuriroseicoccus oceanibius]QQL43832.1 LptF/LptG family permease [Sulfuriroseicoccus oceanibius]
MTKLASQSLYARVLAYLGVITTAILTWVALKPWSTKVNLAVDALPMSRSQEMPLVSEQMWFDFLIAHLGMLAAMLLPAWVVWVIWRHREKGRATLTWPLIWVALALCVTWIPSMIRNGLTEASGSEMGDEPWLAEFWIASSLMLLLILSVPFMAWLYGRARIVDRYVVRNFLGPFALAFGGFTAIWIISDMANNGSDFTEAKVSIAGIARYYGTQLPSLSLLMLPITLLLALLFALSKMSKANELVSLLSAGMSSTRVLMPLIVIGLYATFISFVFSFHWAPRADGAQRALKEEIIEQAQSKKKSKRSRDRFRAEDQAYINRVDNRQWYVGGFPEFYSRKNKIENVVVADFDEEDRLTKVIIADRIYWDYTQDLWIFYEGRVFEYDEEERMVSQTTFPQKHLEFDWRERPWDLITAGINPEHLGVPQLNAFIRSHTYYPEAKLAPFKTFLHHRIALPFGCLTAVLIGAPLGIVYSRRGILGGVASALGIFFAILFLTNLFMALGRSGSMPPFVAAWAANFLFGGIGAYLLWCRARNREVPSPKSLFGSLKRALFPAKPAATSAN